MRRCHWTALTVLFLIAVLVGLALPFFMQLRESARRAKCYGYLKQWALALHASADTDRLQCDGKSLSAFPAGTRQNPDLPSEQRWSWYLATLPFMDEAHIYRQVDLTRGPGDPRNRTAAEYRFAQIVCAASGEYDIDRNRWKSQSPLTHYVGVAGVGPDAAELPAGHPRAGVFGYDRHTVIPGGIPDGTSNTLLLIETSHNPGHWAFGGTATVRGIEPGTAPYVGRGRPFGGFHGNGAPPEYPATAAMADGSARSLAAGIAPEVLEALATVGGKETLPAEW